MTNTTRNIIQSYWTSNYTPYLTIRSTYNSSQSYKPHYHSELSIGIIESNETRLSLPQKELTLKKGDVVIIEPQVVHACNPINGKPRSYYMLYINNEWCCHLLSKIYGYQVTSFSAKDVLINKNNKEFNPAALVKKVQELKLQGTISELENFLLDTLTKYCSPNKNGTKECPATSQIKARLIENISHSPSLDTLAIELEQAKETLIRRFKRDTGITPKSFLNNYRIEKSKILLRSGMKIIDVAGEIGFSDQSQFHRNFVNYTASTPKQYQNLKSIFDNTP